MGSNFRDTDCNSNRCRTLRVDQSDRNESPILGSTAHLFTGILLLDIYINALPTTVYLQNTGIIDEQIVDPRVGLLLSHHLVHIFGSTGSFLHQLPADLRDQ